METHINPETEISNPKKQWIKPDVTTIGKDIIKIGLLLGPESNHTAGTSSGHS